MPDLIKAERATVKFFDGLEIDSYRMPNGEFRVSMSGASVLIGYSPNWLSRTLSRSGTAMKSLQGLGFSGQTQKVVLPDMRLNSESPSTISIPDLSALILYAASNGKPQAIALNKAMVNMSLIDFFRDGHGLRPLSIDEKRDQLYKAFAATLTAQDWLEWDRSDAKAIDDHLEFLGA